MSLSTASISPTKIGPDGNGKITDLLAGGQAALVGGDAFKCQGKEILVVNNGDTGPHTVTVKAVADNFGNVLAGNDLTLVVAAGKVGVIGPFSAAKYADANGLVQLTYDAVTSVKIALYTASVTA